jgi:hypothetical protein
MKGTYHDKFQHKKQRKEMFKAIIWQNLPKLLPETIENSLLLQAHYKTVLCDQDQ